MMKANSFAGWLRQAVQRVTDPDSRHIHEAFDFLSAEQGFSARAVRELDDRSTVAYIHQDRGCAVVISSGPRVGAAAHVVKLENQELPPYPAAVGSDSELKWLDVVYIAEVRKQHSTDTLRQLLKDDASTPEVMRELARLLREHAGPELGGDFGIEPRVRAMAIQT